MAIRSDIKMGIIVVSERFYQYNAKHNSYSSVVEKILKITDSIISQAGEFPNPKIRLSTKFYSAQRRASDIGKFKH